MQIIEFYYMCLFTETSSELLSLVKKNKWYFNKLKLEAQEQLRRLYKIYRKNEEELYK
ncbi:hypothetical protein HMPREF3221_02464 [Fusobacterium nucleatum]|jgi:hypothetical protein|uniref:Uncharacterized protein n=1 Tax=Fusobacterium nucleatum TaxID=851 RepID=A0A133N9P1_FUSNU|nr:hypothetical protein HMPREF3221_02464 [Fusobacterium nucleatum]